MDKAVIRAVLPDAIDQVWPAIEGYLQEVVDVGHGEATLEGIYNRLKANESLLLVALQEGQIIACCVLSIAQFETGKKALEMPYIGGRDIDLWLTDGFDLIKDIARDFGCSHLRGSGRKGWSKMLPELKVIRTVYEMEI